MTKPTDYFVKLIHKRLMNRHFGVSIVALFILAAAIVAPAVYAQTSEGGNAVQVERIRVESLGERLSVDTTMILKQSGIVVGRKITGDDVQEAVKLLWKLKLFSEIEIVKEQETLDGWQLVIRVREFPRMEEWKITGAKKVKVDDIRDKVKLNRGQTLRDYDVFHAEQTILEMYRTEGYLRAKVKSTIEDGALPTTRRLTTKIEEGKKVKIDKIRFTTPTNEKLPFSQRKMRGQLKETKQASLFRGGKFDKISYAKDKESLLLYYRNHGYRDAQILTDSTHYSENGKYLYLDLTLDPGPLFYFGAVTFDGNSRFPTEELLSEVKIKRGDKFSQEKLDMGVLETVRGKYLDKGFLAAQINPILLPATNSPKVDTLNVKIEIVENQEFSVRNINIAGNTKTKERVIRREIVQYPGETFDRSKLSRSIRELTILNFFNMVDPQVLPSGESEVDITFNVEEKQTDQANVQVGYSQRDGMIGSLGFTMPNLFGNAQKFVFDWSFGSYYRNFSVSFDEPYLTYPQTSVGTSLFSQRRGGSYYGYNESLYGGSLRFGRRLIWPDDYFRINYTYQIENTQYSDFTESFRASNANNLEENVWRLSSTMTQVISRDSRDNPEFPTNGSVQALSLTLAGGPFGGRDNYYKSVVSSEWYVPSFWKFVLYSTTEFGVMNGLTANPKNIPYIDYFFMGGSGLALGVPLRGYNERAIGPQTSDGDYAVGGKSFFKQGLELRFPIVPQPTIYGLMFAEAGNVWLSPYDLDPGNLKRSMGLGVRIYMPLVGLIGLDYGYGFDNTDYNGDRKGEWIPHFQFGRGF